MITAHAYRRREGAGRAGGSDGKTVARLLARMSEVGTRVATCLVAEAPTEKVALERIRIHQRAFEFVFEFEASDGGCPRLDGPGSVRLSPSCAKGLLTALSFAIHRYEHFIGPISLPPPPPPLPEPPEPIYLDEGDF